MALDQEHNEEVARASTTRRALLSGAGGFVLAAGGLFLPEWLEDAEAVEGLYGGTLGGRHGKDHRGRDNRKRRNRDRNDAPRNSGSPRPNGIEFDFRRLVTGGPPDTVPVALWIRQPNGAWSLQITVSVANPGGYDFKRTAANFELSAALWIDQKHAVVVDRTASSIPTLILGHGGAFDRASGWHGGTTAVNQPSVQIGTTVQATMDALGFTVRRKSDADVVQRFDVQINAA
jgi:hypothetical protein